VEINHQEEKDAAFQQLAARVRRKCVADIRKHQKLLVNLRSDLEKHGEPDTWKKFGDVLLANPGATRRGDKIVAMDYFVDGAPEIEIEADSNASISETAEAYFRRYAKARNAQRLVTERIDEVERTLIAAKTRLLEIDEAIEQKNEDYLKRLLPAEKKPIAVLRKKKQDVEFKGARRFISSDGFEILVGKKASDNDLLTFRVAKSLDTWMHAADYPGSHVIVRTAGRKEIPDRTLIEAAQLAAFYSDAREQPKAAVNYTLKKFVNKPKRSAPGLVSLSSFKTLLVQPQVGAGITQP
jgi:predicted ribosome quality control (RQC) complex YloA/Tae2 family protein